ncbi:MAG: PEP-CTERM sorting domain-containing protein [Candidatus Korobacteraceae bacterium]
MRLKPLLVVLALCLLVSAPTFAQNLVSNGSFETGDFTSWGTTGNFEFSTVTSGAFYVYTGAEDGNFYGTFGPVGSLGGITQSLTTTAGTGYNFSFWLNAVGDDPSAFQALWDGSPVLAMSDPTTGGVWTQYSFHETGTGHDTIEFDFQDDPAYIALDNVVVSSSATSTSTGTTPEPSSFILLGTGVLALGGFVRRKFRA